MLELRMNAELQEIVPEEIGFNFEELKVELSKRIDHYNHIVVTEDGIKDAKDDRAQLNKLRTAIDTRRKDVKKEYLKPYNEFEGQIKELIALIDEPIKAIDTQLNEYEERRKEEKRERIEELYAGTMPEDIKEIIPLERIFDGKWLNVSTSLKSITETMQDWAERVHSDLLALDTIDEKYQIACREMYNATLSLSEAMAHQTKLKEAEEALRAREEAKRAQEEQRLEAEQKIAQTVEKEPRAAKEEPIHETPQEKRYALRLEFSVTREEAIALRKFIDDNKISYRKI